jgi:flagellar basal-body rod protein FlgG
MLLEMTRPVQGGLRQERKLEVTSNHLANSDTAGFKRDVLSFDRMFRAALNTDFTQGDIRRTENRLDLALADEGFFKVDTPQGVRYTRNGNFNLNADGVLVTQNGDPVLGLGGPVTIDGESVSVNAAGEILVDGAAVDTLDVVTFDRLENLVKEGANQFVYRGDAADEKAPATVAVKQGALEGSAVVTVNEMVAMIDHHRMYETYQKMMLTFDEVDNKAINDVGKLQ